MRNMSRRSVDEDEPNCRATQNICKESSSNNTDRNAPGEMMNVLAVDDNNIDRKLIEMLLKTSSFKVTAVNSAKRALEVLGLGKSAPPGRDKAVEFDLIITDYCMPEMTGYELLKRLKESSVWKDVPVVVMSSENVRFRIDRCMAEGAEEFLLKPVQLADVRRLKGHVRQAMSLKEASLRNEGPGSVSTKRKVQPSQVQTIERRPRLSELAVA